MAIPNIKISIPMSKQRRQSCNLDSFRIGHGNVALDIARILCEEETELKKSDMTQAAVKVLANSRIKRVHVVGRRGPIQSAFTSKELREMLALKSNFLTRRDLIEQDIQQGQTFLKTNRPKRRLLEILHKAPCIQSFDKKWSLDYLASPVKFNHSQGKVTGVVFEQNALQGEFPHQTSRGTGQFFEIPCGLVVTCLGYQNQPLVGLPFDAQQSLVPNQAGQVVDCKGLYVSGWLKRGPKGVIASTMMDAQETAHTILEQLNGEPAPGAEDLDLNRISFKDWLKLDQYELKQGLLNQKPREKVTAIVDMLRVIRQ